jgi:hypothetical protein
MLHDEVKLIIWSRKEIVCVNVTWWCETNNMKSRGNCLCYNVTCEVKLLVWSRE